MRNPVGRTGARFVHGKGSALRTPANRAMHLRAAMLDCAAEPSPMTRYTLDAHDSKLTVRTHAEGVFSPLAHDLEIELPLGAGSEATVDHARWTAKLVVRTDGARVIGTVKRGVLDVDGLGTKDRAEIERRMRAEVFAGLREIVVDAHGDGPSGQATVQGAAISVSLDRRDEVDDGATTAGRATVSMRALGLREVRGPLNAFRVSDRVEVRLDARWKRAE